MSYYHYFTLAKKMVKSLLDGGAILVATDLSIGLESGSPVLRNKQGHSFTTGPLSAVDYFVKEVPEGELYRIVAAKCVWI
jgi:hypothetical protein